MKIKTIIFIFLCFCSGFVNAQSPAKAPALFTENYKAPVTQNQYINCLKINDLGAIIYLNEAMTHYDVFKLELHRFGDDADIIAAYKIFTPASKEFLKKISGKDSLKIKVLAEEDEFGGSDLQVNTTLFPVNSTTNMAFCKSHDLKQCSFYMIIRGYSTTGEKTQFGEDVYDKGTDLSARSVVFKSWESKTK